jgi:hypothetical protein
MSVDKALAFCSAEEAVEVLGAAGDLGRRSAPLSDGGPAECRGSRCNADTIARRLHRATLKGGAERRTTKTPAKCIAWAVTTLQCLGIRMPENVTFDLAKLDSCCGCGRE